MNQQVSGGTAPSAATFTLAVADVLRRERQDLFQRELLLDTVIQSTPLAHSGRPIESRQSS